MSGVMSLGVIPHQLEVCLQADLVYQMTRVDQWLLHFLNCFCCRYFLSMYINLLVYVFGFKRI